MGTNSCLCWQESSCDELCGQQSPQLSGLSCCKQRDLNPSFELHFNKLSAVWVWFFATKNVHRKGAFNGHSSETMSQGNCFVATGVSPSLVFSWLVTTCLCSWSALLQQQLMLPMMVIQKEVMQLCWFSKKWSMWSKLKNEQQHVWLSSRLSHHGCKNPACSMFLHKAFQEFLSCQTLPVLHHCWQTLSLDSCNCFCTKPKHPLCAKGYWTGPIPGMWIWALHSPPCIMEERISQCMCKICAGMIGLQVHLRGWWVGFEFVVWLSWQLQLLFHCAFDGSLLCSSLSPPRFMSIVWQSSDSQWQHNIVWFHSLLEG